MSSIPLPALAIQPPPDALGNVQKLMAIKSMLGQQALQPGQQQLQQQQIEGGRQENQLRSMAIQDQTTLRSVAPKYIQKDDNGKVTGFDFDGLVNDATGKGVNPATLQQLQLQHYQTVEAKSKAGTEALNLEDAKNNQVYQIMESVRGIKDPVQRQQAVRQSIPQLQQLGLDTSKIPPNVTDDQLDSLEATLAIHKQQLSDAKSVADINKSNADEFKEVPGTGMFFNPLTKETRTAQGGATLSPQMMESKYVQVQQAMKLGQPVTPEDKAFAQGYEKMKTLVPQFNLNMQAGLLNPQAKDMAAENYFQTGQLPAGARSPAMVSSIINRAAQLHPNGTTELAGNRASYDANKKSYDNVTGTLDTLTAFENSGLKNLKQFTDLANKLPDTGIPWVNSPIRTLDEKAVGAEYLPAINAAKEVGLREIARVTNDPKLSGSLTDSARGEVQGFIPKDATFNQIKHVVDVLTNDMANVHTSLAQQKADIGGRLGIKAAAAEAGVSQVGGQGQNQQSVGHKVGDIIVQNGHQFTVDSIDKNGKVTAAH